MFQVYNYKYPKISFSNVSMFLQGEQIEEKGLKPESYLTWFNKICRHILLHDKVVFQKFNKIDGFADTNIFLHNKVVFSKFHKIHGFADIYILLHNKVVCRKFDKIDEFYLTCHLW